MVKIIYNGLIIDLCKNERYLSYVSSAKRYIEVKPYAANAILGSDNNTVYHLYGTPANFPETLKTVNVYEINEDEYNSIRQNNLTKVSVEETTLKEEVNNLKDVVSQQNLLIQQLLEKLRE